MVTNETGTQGIQRVSNTQPKQLLAGYFSSVVYNLQTSFDKSINLVVNKSSGFLKTTWVTFKFDFKTGHILYFQETNVIGVTIVYHCVEFNRKKWQLMFDEQLVKLNFTALNGYYSF